MLIPPEDGAVEGLSLVVEDMLVLSKEIRQKDPGFRLRSSRSEDLNCGLRRKQTNDIDLICKFL